jgi:hypothetical protein
VGTKLGCNAWIGYIWPKLLLEHQDLLGSCSVSASFDIGSELSSVIAEKSRWEVIRSRAEDRAPDRNEVKCGPFSQVICRASGRAYA